MIKKHIPNIAKITFKKSKTAFNDFIKGYHFKFAKSRGNQKWTSKHLIKITQDLNPNESKLNNLILAKNAIEKITVLSDEIFSFWKIVRAPIKKNGFKASRSIRENKITETIGGGLCQISGLIYHVCLLAGLEIIERHNHSIDIYTEESRFAPLGSDATLVYGYKDLRFKNNLDSPIKFEFIIEPDKFSIVMITDKEIERKSIQFMKIANCNNTFDIKTFSEDKLIDISRYKTANI